MPKKGATGDIFFQFCKKNNRQYFPTKPPKKIGKKKNCGRLTDHNCGHPLDRKLFFSGRLKPIFHQNAKYLASGTFASGNAKSSTFALADARNTNMLVSFALGDANFLHWPCTFHFFCVYFICVG